MVRRSCLYPDEDAECCARCDTPRQDNAGSSVVTSAGGWLPLR